MLQVQGTMTDAQRDERNQRLIEELGLAKANQIAARLDRQEKREVRHEFKRHAFRVTACSGGGARERARRAKRFG